MTDHVRGPGFFTIIAGTCIVGSQFVILFQNLAVARSSVVSRNCALDDRDLHIFLQQLLFEILSLHWKQD